MLDADEVSEAIVLWSGKGDFPIPRRSEARVIARFGEDRGLDLLPRVRQLEHEFYESKAYAIGSDLAAVGRKAAEEFRMRHPEISEAAVHALAWCYTWDWR